MAIAIILSGGAGLRASTDIPKQYIEVNNTPVIADSIGVFQRHEDISEYAQGKIDGSELASVFVKDMKTFQNM